MQMHLLCNSEHTFYSGQCSILVQVSINMVRNAANKLSIMKVSRPHGSRNLTRCGHHVSMLPNWFNWALSTCKGNPQSEHSDGTGGPLGKGGGKVTGGAFALNPLDLGKWVGVKETTGSPRPWGLGLEVTEGQERRGQSLTSSHVD